MELIELNNLLASGFEPLKNAIKNTRKYDEWKTKHKIQYDPKLHAVHSTTLRPWKMVNSDDENGNSTTTAEDVNRISMPIQKQIVGRAATFLCGNPVELDTLPVADLQPVEAQLLQILEKMWRDNKLDYETKTIAKILFSETEVAELWFFEDAPTDYWRGTPNASVPALNATGKAVNGEAQSRVRMKILANSKGDTMTPLWNSVGDMIAFVREYNTVQDGKEIPHFDLYLENQTIKWTRNGDNTLNWSKETFSNPIKKLPIIYYCQDRTEWYDVQEMIERLEELYSNLADTNDYNGSPIVLVHGTVKGFSAKGEQGKVLELDEGANAEYLTWPSAPESIKLEIEQLLAAIYDLTDTPNISFDQVKGLGAFSGIALRMIFMAAHMKASDHEETVGKSLQRRLNLLKAMAATINIKLTDGLNLDIKPKFDYYIPKNVEETITLLNSAYGGGIMSQETAVHQNPLVEDPEEEFKKITKEADDAAARAAASSNII
jgi:SPP1 family phage portal protein